VIAGVGVWMTNTTPDEGAGWYILALIGCLVTFFLLLVSCIEAVHSADPYSSAHSRIFGRN
jgi:hypothetical protein